MSDGSGLCLVTGGTGFLGRRVVRELAQSGRTVRALVRPGTDPDVFRKVVGDLPNPQIELAFVSFSDRVALRRACEHVQVVLHAAASKQGAAAAQVANTVVGSDLLYQASIEAGVRRFVLVSSFAVIGAAVLPRGAVVDDETPMELHPEWRDSYSFAKHRQEQLAWKYHREVGLPLVVVRPGVIFGPGQPILHTRVGMNVLGLFLHLGAHNTIPLTYVDNSAHAVVLAGVTPEIEGEIFCIVDDCLPTSTQLLQRYRKQVKSFPYLPVPFPVLRQVARINAWYSERTHGHLPPAFTPYKVSAMWGGHRYSNEKAKRRLGWTARVPMDQALDLTFASQPT